jgi:uncharacterized protein
MQHLRAGMRHATIALVAFSICLVSLVPDVHGQQPSFNCKTNTAPDERTICASKVVSQLDRQMDDLYVALRDSLDAGQQALLREAQRSWLRKRAACGTNASCIAALYQARIPQLRALLAGTTGVPQAQPGTPPQTPSPGGGRDACDAFPTLC